MKIPLPESETAFVPDWAAEAVWYQIFPERFRNSNPANDPTLEEIGGAYPDAPGEPWAVSPWTSDWYELQPWEKTTGKDIWWNIQRRRYGGDLQGVLDKLDYLEDLGITAIYFNPVFMAPSLHKYDAATYHHVDPTFGPDPEGDRKLIDSEIPDDPSTWVWTSADKLALELIREIHKRDMRVIFDGVFNHMGVNSWAFQDVMKNQQDSKHADWFSVTSWRNPEEGTEFDYQGWFGVKTLPELRENENGIVEGPKKYIFDATRRWMDPNGDGNPEDGIDGWRLDVAFCVAHPFWKDWRRHVKSINPEAYLTAEVIDPIPVLQEYLQGDEFDAVMNYNFAFTCSEFFVKQTHGIPVSEFDQKLRDLREAFHPAVAYVQQNLFDSHDTNRIGSHIVNENLGHYREWADYFQASKAENPDYKTRKPTDDERRIQKLFAIMQMTYVGAPMVYYGDEVGMWGANDPCCRKPMVWDDLVYRPERFLPDQSIRADGDPVYPHTDLLDHYKELIAIRKASPALMRGDFGTLLTDDERGIYAFERIGGGERVIVVLNNRWDEAHVRIPVQPGEVYIDYLNNNEQFRASEDGLTVEVEGKWGRILGAK